MPSLKSLVVCAVALAACDRSASKTPVDFHRPVPPGASEGTWVARYATESITDAELNRRFAEMSPYARARFQTIEQRRDYVEGVIRFELLAREAIRQGLANDPDVVETARRGMVQALLKKELEERADSVTDAQVREYYQQHVADYVKPAMTRLSHLAFAKAHRAAAEAALEKVKAMPPLDFAAFGKLAREQSEDDQTKVLDGDLRFLSDDELSKRFGPVFAEAASKLEKVGDSAPGLIEAGERLHIIKLQGRQIAMNLSVEQAKPSIQQVLLNATRQERFRALLERLKKESNVQINESTLSSLVIDPKAPAVEGKGPQPTYLPAPQEPLPSK
jgi:peptidyl-prolyl cis-trans isomerase C